MWKYLTLFIFWKIAKDFCPLKDIVWSTLYFLETGASPASMKKARRDRTSRVGTKNVSRKPIGSFRIDDGNGNDKQRQKLSIWLVEWGKISVLYVRHSLMDKSVSSSAQKHRKTITFIVLMTTWAYNRESLILCIYFNGVPYSLV